MTPTKKGKGCNQILPPEISETTFRHQGGSADTINYPLFQIVMTCLLLPEQVCV